MLTPVDNLTIVCEHVCFNLEEETKLKRRYTFKKIVLNISIAVLVDGGLTEWSEWGRCDQLCEPGKQRRHKTCINPKRRCGGKQCDPNVATTEEKPCMYCPGKHFITNIW